MKRLVFSCLCFCVPSIVFSSAFGIFSHQDLTIDICTFLCQGCPRASSARQALFFLDYVGQSQKRCRDTKTARTTNLKVPHPLESNTLVFPFLGL